MAGDKLGRVKLCSLAEEPNDTGFWTVCPYCMKSFWCSPGGVHVCDGPITFEDNDTVMFAPESVNEIFDVDDWFSDFPTKTTWIQRVKNFFRRIK